MDVKVNSRIKAKRGPGICLTAHRHAQLGQRPNAQVEWIPIGQLVCSGANMQCSFGTAPSSLIVLPSNRTMASMPAANIMDNKPMLNILPFGMCNSLANPTVASATAAALGVLTPMPCIPLTAAPWVPGSPTVLIGNMPALNHTCKCMCNWGGVIQITNPGQMTVQVP